MKPEADARRIVLPRQLRCCVVRGYRQLRNKNGHGLRPNAELLAQTRYVILGQALELAIEELDLVAQRI